MHTYVLRLRRTLGDQDAKSLRTSGSGYVMDLTDGVLDTERFAALRSSAREAAEAGRWSDAAAQNHAALALWRGEVLSDVPELDEHDEPRRLTELRWLTTEDWIETQLVLGRDGDVVAELRALTAAHPLRERFHEQLMLALYRTGRQAEALEAYQRVRKTAIGELGGEPGSALRRLQEAILRGDSPDSLLAGPRPEPAAVPSLAKPFQLPADIGGFTGRRPEQDTVAGWLSERSEEPGRGMVVAVVTGTAGVGKTAFAVHVARQVASYFPDGVLYASLHGGTSRPRSPDDVIEAFLAALGSDIATIPANLDARQAAYRSALSGRRMLLLLGLWPGPDIHLRAAAALFGTETRPARTALEALTDLNLVESGPGDRYRQHDLIRAYAIERAQDELTHAERSAAARRIVTWFLWGADDANAAAERMRRRLDASERTATGLGFAGATDAFEWLSAERLNLLAAVQMAAEYEHNDIAWQLPWLLEEFFISRLHLADWTGSCTIGLACARRAGDAAAEARMLGVLANNHYKMGDAARSIDCRTQALEVYRRSGDRRAEANATASLGMAYLLAGDIAGAITWGERAVPMVRAEHRVRTLVRAQLAGQRLSPGGQVRRRDQGLHWFAGRRPRGGQSGGRGRDARRTRPDAAPVRQAHGSDRLHAPGTRPVPATGRCQRRSGHPPAPGRCPRRCRRARGGANLPGTLAGNQRRPDPLARHAAGFRTDAAKSRGCGSWRAGVRCRVSRPRGACSAVRRLLLPG
jgi:tetratricopeptide (TPR) repeat protein